MLKIEFVVTCDKPNSPDVLWTNHYSTESFSAAQEVLIRMVAIGRKNVKLEVKETEITDG